MNCIIKLKDILLLEAFGDGIYIYTTQNIFTSRETLKKWEKVLDKSIFIKINRSYIISFQHLEKITDSEIKLIGKKDIIPIARRRGKKVKEAFYDYIAKNAKVIN